MNEIKVNLKKNWWKALLTIVAMVVLGKTQSESSLAIAWFIPLIAAGISAIGAIGSAAIQSRGARDQQDTVSRANEVMNQQWKEQMMFEKREADRSAFNDVRNQFNQSMINNANLRKTIVDIWSGR